MRKGSFFQWSIVFLALLSSSVFVSEVLGADVREGSFELGAFGGYNIFEGNQWLEDSPVFGGRLGYFLSRDFSLEFSTSYTPTEYDIDSATWPDQAGRLSGRDVDLIHFRLEVLYHFASIWDRLVPFVGAGAGAALLNSPIIDNEVDPEFSIGAGIKCFITDDLLIRADARYVVQLDESLRVSYPEGEPLPDSGHSWNDMEGVIGVSYLFGGKVKDSDGDGVLDDTDACPDTPKGVVVDARGCPLDSDGDGVSDGIDACPGTPLGAQVDSKGCPKDSDGDGVFDGLDQCPDTPMGTPVNEVGCPMEERILDSDSDGVLDDVDKCPNTPPKILVDETGCTVGKKSIFFEFDSATLTKTSRENMAGMADIFKNAIAKSPTAKVEIQGHTDSKGSAAYNQKLSLKRAEAVKEYLVNQGVPASRLPTKGFGATQPVAPNTTDNGRALNRRIEFVILSQ